MELGEAGLQQQPFRTHGRPLVFVRYASQQAAFEFLADIHKRERGLGLFQGPPLSGKTAIIHHFSESLSDGAAVAIVDGAGLNTTALLEALLSQFGYDIPFSSANELLNMVKVFVLQQTGAGQPPLLIVENTHALNPSALRVLCELAGLHVRFKSALRLILASDRSISPIVRAPAMEAISRRLSGDFHLQPMTISETSDYLHAKLRAGGCLDPMRVFPLGVCDEMHWASGGWPGVLDRLALLSIAKATRCPVGKEHIERPLVPSGAPSLVDDSGGLRGNEAGGTIDSGGPPRLFLTYNGRTLREIEFDRSRILVGRSDHNDVCVNSRFISRHHALFVRQGAATFLLDLNSTNGTYVNSKRITNHVLTHDDVISIGNHGIKFHDPNAQDGITLDGDGFDDTAIMRNLQDMRRLLAKQNTQARPVERHPSSD